MRQNGLEARAALGRREWLMATALAAVLLAGCGAEAYDQRLGNTKLMFAHLEFLNQNLQGTWGDPETGVGLRVPLQFVLLPPPVRAEPDPAANKPAGAANGGAANEDVGGEPAAMGEVEEEEGSDEVPDDRQPKFINIGLPGLRGAFRATVKMIAENNKTSEGEAFLYVLTNHNLADQPEQAKEFEQEFIKILTESLHVSIDPKDWRDDQIPPGDPANNGFVRPLKYKNVTVTPAEDIAGYTRQFSAYMFDQGDIQVIVLFVLPANTDSSENFTKRIPLCLETLSVSGNKLSLPMKGGAPAGAGTQSAF